MHEVEIPVMIGDTVYTNMTHSGWRLRRKDAPYACHVVFVGLNGAAQHGGGIFNVEIGHGLGRMLQFRFSDIGRAVFLTREEAIK